MISALHPMYDFQVQYFKLKFSGLQHCVGRAVQHDQRAKVRDPIRDCQWARVQHNSRTAVFNAERATVHNCERARVQHRSRATMQHCPRHGERAGKKHLVKFSERNSNLFVPGVQYCKRATMQHDTRRTMQHSPRAAVHHTERTAVLNCQRGKVWNPIYGEVWRAVFNGQRAGNARFLGFPKRNCRRLIFFGKVCNTVNEQQCNTVQEQQCRTVQDTVNEQVTSTLCNFSTACDIFLTRCATQSTNSSVAQWTSNSVPQSMSR